MEPVRKDGAEVFRFEQSGGLLRKVMENAAVGMVLVGVDRRLLYANGAFCAMLGYAAGGAVGLDIDAVLSADKSRFAAELTELLAGSRESVRAEGAFRRRDGSVVWMLAAGSVLRSERTGRPLYVILQLSDIDRQKQAEAALAHSESRWSAALEAAGQGVWDFDARTGTIYYSPTWRKMRGIPADEYVDPAQDKWLARIHPDDRDRIRATVGRQQTGQDGFDTLEYRERRRDGSYIWILSRGRPVEWDATGRVVRTIGTDTDITRLKTAESQLAEEKERLRVTLHSIGDGVISTDEKGCVTFMNPIAERMTGWKLPAAIGRSVDEVFHVVRDSDDAPLPDPVTACIAGKAPSCLDVDVVLVGRKGERHDIRSSAAPVRTPGGRVIGAVLIFQDVGHSRALQKKLAHSASHDPMTGLANRIAFDRALAEATETAAGGARHALCFIDLDRFKPVNDTAGHAAGDELLRLVSETIRGNCRSGDMAARIGGDEFALLLPDCPLGKAVEIGENIVAAIERLRFEWQGTRHLIGASIGVTEVSGRASLLGFIGEADAACYAAKAAGRGCVRVFTDPAEEGAA